MNELDRRSIRMAPSSPAATAILPGAGQLTVIVPTFNESSNIAPLITALESALDGVVWEVIFVDDDSPDGTAEAVKALSNEDRRIHCMRRIGRRGLSGAVVEGIMLSAAPFVAVIDADFQHDERLLGEMLAALTAGEADLVIASRYLDHGDSSQDASPLRRFGSHVATALAHAVLKAEVSDPVSGFFMIRREAVESVAGRLSDEGFKILFDIIASQPKPLRILELPYDFRRRRSGQSKLDSRIVVDYLGLVLSKLTGGLMPPRALLYGLVGASGVAVNLVALKLALMLGTKFAAAQLAAALIAMTSNFLVNNAVTYRDRRLRGWRAMLAGYVRFCGLCGLGLIANVAVAELVHRFTPVWWLAGTAGALFGAAWNYVSTYLAVW